jgi:DNA topoisomerase I
MVFYITESVKEVEGISGKLAELLKPQVTYIQEATTPGIKRLKKGKGWAYINPDGSLCKDPDTLGRIKSLAIPPAWRDVWICPDPLGHLQATGIDTKNRKQYRYHGLWVEDRKKGRFQKLVEFGRCLPNVREQAEKDLRRQGLCKRKIIALIVLLLDRTCIRIGNECYKKLYNSYGLTTLRDKHVSFEGKKVVFRFKGKKGVYHEIACSEARLAALVKKCKDIPGQELFQYYDEQGKHHPVTSENVNAYLREICERDFTAKDFRTWRGTSYTLKSLIEQQMFETKKECKKKIVKAIEEASKRLGNTIAICKKHYIHPDVLTFFEKGELFDLILSKSVVSFSEKLSEEENLLLNILEKGQNTVSVE